MFCPLRGANKRINSETIKTLNLNYLNVIGTVIGTVRCNAWFNSIMKTLYDVKSLFTNIPIDETISYIIEHIYVHKKLAPIRSKLILRRLVIEL